MTSVVCINQFANGEVEIVSIKQEPETDGDAADQPEPLNLSKPKFPKLENKELTIIDEKSDDIFISETGQCKEELHDIKQTLKDLIQSRRLAEGKNVLTPVDLVSSPVKTEMSQEEVVRAEERKEQNRKAAHRCRMRRKQQMQILKEEEAKLKRRRKELEAQINHLSQEKQKLLLTIRSDKCADKNHINTKGGNSMDRNNDFEVIVDLSDTDASLTDSQEMPLNLHKEADDVSNRLKKNRSKNPPVVPNPQVVKKNMFDSESAEKKDCKFCCCPCRCHHDDIIDTDGSLSDTSFELDVNTGEIDNQQNSETKSIPKTSVGEDEIKKSTTYWKKSFSRSLSDETSPKVQNLDISCEKSDEKETEDDLNKRDLVTETFKRNTVSETFKRDMVPETFKGSLKAFHFKTIEGKSQQVHSVTKLDIPRDFAKICTKTAKHIPRNVGSNIIGEGISCKKYGIQEKFDSNIIQKEEQNATQIKKCRITCVSDNDSQYFSDSSDSSPSLRTKNKYEHAFDAMKMDEIALNCLNSIYSQKKPFFYKDTMN